MEVNQGADFIMIKRLRPFVTSFSEAIMTQHTHGEEVCVGGEVKYVLDGSLFLDEKDIGDPTKDPGVYLTLDDGVGFNYIVAPKQACERFEKENGPLQGKVILAVGKIMDLDMRQEKKKIMTFSSHPEKTKRVAAYYLGLVPELSEDTGI